MLFTDAQWSDIMLYAWGWLLLVGAYMLTKSIRETFK